MREWVDIHAQLEEAVEELAARASRRREAQPEGGSPKAEGGRRSPNLASAVAKYAAIHRSILTGLFGHVAQREERNKYRLGGNKQAMVFPGSGLFEKAPLRGRGGELASGRQPLSPERGHPQPPWLVAGELMETSRLFLRIVAAMDPEWIIELAPHLVKTTHEHPHWDRESGRVVCVEKVLLRGLVLRERRVGYLKVNPADATTLFTRSALIEGDLDPTPYRFLEHNRQMREKVEMWQTRLPHRLVADLDEALFRFYAQRLQEAGSTHDLDRMLKTHEPSFLCATEADLLGEHARQFNPATFPDTLAVGGQSVFVKYAYAPGE
jgi:ATP-dependent helicase HrpA